MNKSDLIAELARRSNVTHKKSSEICNLVFNAMTKELVKGGRIEIRGFGSFVNKEYDEYIGRNPKTKEMIRVPKKRLPYFKVGKELRQRVDGNFGVKPEEDQTP